MPIDVDKQLDELFEAQDQRSARYSEMLPKTDDVALVVLKGHLIVEEMLFAIAAAHCARPAELEKAKLSFAQLLHVTQSLLKMPSTPRTWEAIALLNSMRNSLVHNLEPREIDRKIVALDQLCIMNDEPYPPGYEKPTEPARIAACAISFIMGSLSVITPMATFIERNRKLPLD